MITEFETLHSIFGKCHGTQEINQLCHIVHYLLMTEPLSGGVVEFGVLHGHTAMVLRVFSQKPLWLYDGFQGIPISGNDQKAREGGVDEIRAYFSQWPVPQPNIIAKWFKDVLPSDLPEEIAFAHLDGDAYESIHQSLELVGPRMVIGGIIIVHDYDDANWPGVRPAINEWLANRKDFRGSNLPREGGLPGRQYCIKKLSQA